jgi:thymidylate synthase
MAGAFTGPTCVDAWLKVAHHLLHDGAADSNIMVTITNPLAFDASWLGRFDPKAVRAEGDSIRDVMNTVFPLKSLHNAASRHEFYERYEKAHARSRNKRWGTYFLRLISFGDKKINQLERVIACLNNWKKTAHAALTVHLSSPELDSLRPIGAPCWHFGEFLCPDRDTIDLVVLYRNHDYFNKALGNFLGLARLLRYVCDQTKRRPGQLVCHSVRAYYEASKAQLQELVSR